MADHLPEWIGRLIERVEATGRQMDALGGKLDRMDEKLEGVAYRRDIEHFVARDEIERRIDKAVDGAKAEAAKGLAEIAGQVRDLRKIGWGLASAALLAFGGIVLAKIGLAGRRAGSGTGTAPPSPHRRGLDIPPARSPRTARLRSRWSFRAGGPPLA
ncbi:MAG: hypothetical protein EKK43_17135 [Methylobacterium sp.]|uniref:hypothetical protein n=1 Tax=Methylobacterium sp. TaxID=409 RepID=UPI000FBE0E4D|nr:hypothetical protein [Methylobacterium sp.]RUP13378.1 MAG: hypothetical protein EKK43_17135 [Methylobacterium sp.]